MKIRSIFSKDMDKSIVSPFFWLTVYRRWRHSPTAHRCWCVVSVRRRPIPWYDRLTPEAHSTHGVYCKLTTGLRSGKLGSHIWWDKSGVSWFSSALLVCLWRDVTEHCPAEERKTRFQMLHECREAASVSKRRRDSTSHWFWPLVWVDARTTQYEFIVLNGQTIRLCIAYHKIV